MTEKLPELPPVKKISPRVVRVLGGNPSKFTLQGTNTYLVGTGAKRILIDTGQGIPVWAESLRKALRDESASIDQVILTHWHHDHTSGVKDVLKLCSDAKVYKSRLDDNAEFLDIQNGQRFQTEGATLKAFHCPGHTVDHMALVLEEEDAMFTGDNVLGHGTAVFEDLAAYMDSLERMQHQFWGRAYPGHGGVIENGKAKIKEYIEHRKLREKEALDLLKQKPDGSEEGWASMAMVKVIYKAYPEHLHGPAEGSLLHVLKKLEKDGRVQKQSDGSWSLTEKAAL